MNDLLNALFVALDTFFLPLMLLGPAGFLLLLPFARDRRRRARDPHYRALREAYASFKRQPAKSLERWQAFLTLLAVRFRASNEAWTQGDSREALHAIGANPAEIGQVCELHAAIDAREFGGGGEVRYHHLDGLAKRVLRTANQTLLLLCVLAFLGGPDLHADEWTDAEARFRQAQHAVAGSEEARTAYIDAALKFQAAAESRARRGSAWVNAGNAWFQAGALGRSIAAYRQAQRYRPFDPHLAENLAAARAITLNEVPNTRAWWQRLPSLWLRALLVVLNLIFWSLLLAHIRYRSRGGLVAVILAGAGLLGVCSVWMLNGLTSRPDGVVVVDAVHARKGPGYAYAKAFHEPLHDGLEFTLIEQRADWVRVRLPDTRQCWLPAGQMQRIR